MCAQLTQPYVVVPWCNITITGMGTVQVWVFERSAISYLYPYPWHPLEGLPETEVAHKGQCIGTFVHGKVLKNFAVFLYCIPE